MNVIGKGK